MDCDQVWKNSNLVSSRYSTKRTFNPQFTNSENARCSQKTQIRGVWGQWGRGDWDQWGRGSWSHGGWGRELRSGELGLGESESGGLGSGGVEVGEIGVGRSGSWGLVRRVGSGGLGWGGFGVGSGELGS